MKYGTGTVLLSLFDVHLKKIMENYLSLYVVKEINILFYSLFYAS